MGVHPTSGVYVFPDRRGNVTILAYALATKKWYMAAVYDALGDKAYRARFCTILDKIPTRAVRVDVGPLVVEGSSSDTLARWKVLIASELQRALTASSDGACSTRAEPGDCASPGVSSEADVAPASATSCSGDRSEATDAGEDRTTAGASAPSDGGATRGRSFSE